MMIGVQYLDISNTALWVLLTELKQVRVEGSFIVYMVRPIVNSREQKMHLVSSIIFDVTLI